MAPSMSFQSSIHEGGRSAEEAVFVTLVANPSTGPLS